MKTQKDMKKSAARKYLLRYAIYQELVLIFVSAIIGAFFIPIIGEVVWYSIAVGLFALITLAMTIIPRYSNRLFYNERINYTWGEIFRYRDKIAEIEKKLPAKQEDYDEEDRRSLRKKERFQQKLHNLYLQKNLYSLAA